MEDLRKLLGRHPSVRRFNALLANCTAEEKQVHYHRIYRLALSKWSSCSKRYQEFFRNFIKHDWQSCLNYIHKETVLGVLGYSLDNPIMFEKMCNLVERKSKNHPVSYNHLAFSLLLSFNLNLKNKRKRNISVLGDQIRTTSFYPEELKLLLGYAHILN
ncbi:hypothetical protein M2459_001097 [Parabacteroides sp. PF5-5]|uniref:hypothetical protein n=1 Tax=unclassified Parabacteroides TaxID=2649774 RepID=UPI0024745314|nr:MULTISPECIES: hypothetical protein [unclassified Parabacteroides]MDH6304364.1 hypothetical protein [Parabacteroides sp. PH5-39]MDH6315483.1 hypothetical protein [Parabacteroides sp. PF5-13]MDH6319023.1 hypothetical protein [Parabacteroides sp. PH5-13]MDH6322753.1 hypothetical protein [Parabacteroides sp. PH5-8]MDH6326675.1 hypothetical protein [Parabacteroides sp. PH5-41]